MTRYRVERSRDVGRDLRAIYLHLIRAHLSFGESFEEARGRANSRLIAIGSAMEALGDVPHQGTQRDDVALGLRVVTKDRAVFYFDVDDEKRVVRVNAVFFGGQDHQRHMLRRLLQRD